MKYMCRLHLLVQLEGLGNAHKCSIRPVRLCQLYTSHKEFYQTHFGSAQQDKLNMKSMMHLC